MESSLRVVERAIEGKHCLSIESTGDDLYDEETVKPVEDPRVGMQQHHQEDMFYDVGQNGGYLSAIGERNFRQ